MSEGVKSKKYDIVLINTPTMLGQSTIRLGLLHIASYVRKNGFSVTIIDGDLNAVKRQITGLNLSESIVGMTATTDVVSVAIDICSEVKKNWPKSFCILGGTHVTALPKQTMEESKFDAGVVGEGEITFMELLKNRQDKKPLDTIAGLVIRDGDEIKLTPPRELIKDLDILPFPAYDLININDHLAEIRYEKVTAKKCMYVLLSRGCPFDCRFCSSCILWHRRIRWFSVDYSIRLVKKIVTKYNLDAIAFVDDEFLCIPDRVKEFLEKFRPFCEEHNLKWECQARVTSVTEKNLKLLKDSGCQLIRFGIESGSPKVIEFLKRGSVTVEAAHKAIKLCNKVGLPAYASFILGSPEDTIEDIALTLEFITDSGLSSAAVFVAVPYPGTNLYEICMEKGYIDKDIAWSKFCVEGDGVIPIISSKNFTAEQLFHINNYVQANVIRPLNKGKKPNKLNHRAEIQKILDGDLSMTKEPVHVRLWDYSRKAVNHPDKIVPFIRRKIRKARQKDD